MSSFTANLAKNDASKARFFINHPGKYVFSAVNSGEYVVVYSENANEQKEKTPFALH